MSVRLKRRRGMRLAWAFLKTVPEHYRITRRSGGSRWLAWGIAWRLVWVGWSVSRRLDREGPKRGLPLIWARLREVLALYREARGMGEGRILSALAALLTARTRWAWCRRWGEDWPDDEKAAGCDPPEALQRMRKATDGGRGGEGA